MEAITNHFLSSTRLGDQETRVEQVMRAHLPHIRQRVGRGRRLNDVCLLADAGDTITHLLDVLAHLASLLTHGDATTEYVERRIEDSDQSDDFSDLDIVDYLDDKHASLKYIMNVS